MVISKFFLSMTQQVLEWRLVQVRYRNDKLVLFLSDIDCKIALWRIHCLGDAWFAANNAFLTPGKRKPNVVLIWGANCLRKVLRILNLECFRMWMICVGPKYLQPWIYIDKRICKKPLIGYLNYWWRGVR